MRTNVLAYLIGVVGLIVIFAGAWGVIVLLAGHIAEGPTTVLRNGARNGSGGTFNDWHRAGAALIDADLSSPA
jgi:hypothetical protein